MSAPSATPLMVFVSRLKRPRAPAIPQVTNALTHGQNEADFRESNNVSDCKLIGLLSMGKPTAVNRMHPITKQQAHHQPLEATLAASSRKAICKARLAQQSVQSPFGVRRKDLHFLALWSGKVLQCENSTAVFFPFNQHLSRRRFF